jgi:predicted O-methyltransferase YrrM
LAETLGLFQAFEKSPKSSRDLAKQLRLSERGVRAILEALESVGYVRQSNGNYALTAMAAKWMPRLRNGMKFFESMAFEGWAEMEAKFRSEENGDQGTRCAQTVFGRKEGFDGSLSNARFSVDEVVRRVRLDRSARRLVDVGGGHGLYSARFCQKYPKLGASVIDDEEVLARARGVIETEGVRDRIVLQAADFWSDDIGGDYDVALLFNQLNAYPTDLKLKLLRRVASIIKAGGVIVILDQIRQSTLRGTAKAIVELTNLRLFDPAQRDTYSLSDLQQWLKLVGLKSQRTISLLSTPWLCVVIARKP